MTSFADLEAAEQATAAAYAAGAPLADIYAAAVREADLAAEYELTHADADLELDMAAAAAEWEAEPG